MPCTFVDLVGDATRACRAGGAQHATLGGWQAMPLVGHAILGKGLRLHFTMGH